jgi:hypothetical protein
MICRFCGKEIEEESLICNYCAKPVIRNENRENIESPEEIEKREKNNIKSIKYAKISLWCNGIAIILTLIWGFCVFNTFLQVCGVKILVKNYAIDIPDNSFRIVLVMWLPYLILLLVGIFLGIASNIIYNKNKISKVALVISFLIFIVISVFVCIAVTFWVIASIWFMGLLVKGYGIRIIVYFQNMNIRHNLGRVPIVPFGTVWDR